MAKNEFQTWVLLKTQPVSLCHQLPIYEVLDFAVASNLDSPTKYIVEKISTFPRNIFLSSRSSCARRETPSLDHLKRLPSQKT
jgi:hypothetical protein